MNIPTLFLVLGPLLVIVGIVSMAFRRSLSRLTNRWEIPVIWRDGESTPGLFILLGSGFALIGGVFLLLAISNAGAPSP